MNKSDFSAKVDASFKNFMDYVTKEYPAQDRTPVTYADLFEYSNQIINILSDMKRAVIDYVENQ